MKLAIFLLLTWFTTSLSNLDEPTNKVKRTSSDAQIRETERQVLQQYGVKVDIKVMKRNGRGEITDLRCVRYNKAGKEASSCSSDKFGLLVITETGCMIADLGHEDEI
jgi:hypothetical protein